MKMVNGIALPDHEEHLIDYVQRAPLVEGIGTYQHHKYTAAVARVKRRGLAIDVGAHVGLWSRVMSLDFSEVLAFEPVADHVACWRKNVTAPNARLIQVALGAVARPEVEMLRPAGNSGNAKVARNLHPGGERVRMSTLDDEVPAEKVVDFVKIDCEGYEMFVLQGARQTIQRNRPVIIVEQKRGNGQHYGLGQIDAVRLLEEWSYKAIEVIAGDYIMVHPSSGARR